MNSKSLQYNETENSTIELPALPRKQILAALAKTVTGLLAGGQFEQKQDIVNTLSLEEKLRLGMYRHMD